MNIESLALDEPLEMSQFKDETLPRVKEMEKVCIISYCH